MLVATKRMIKLSAIENSYPLEHDSEGEFVWAQETFSFPKIEADHVLLHACYHGENGELSFKLTDGTHGKVDLHFGWNEYLLTLNKAPERIECKVSPMIECKTDSRKLGLMIRSIHVVNNPAEVKHRLDRIANLKLNQAEYETGVTKLQSIPPYMRTSLETRCNIVPRCVYCHWDYAKQLETRCDFNPGSLQTLEQLGVFIKMAVEIHDCSWGEVFVSKSFPQVAEYLLKTGSECTFTTNGILMTEDRCEPLLAQPVRLYVSLDVSNAELFSRYRNSKFDDVITNIRRLCQRKKQHENKPDVHIICIAMASNFNDIPNVLELAADLGVDGFFLQALHKQNMSRQHPVVQNGYEFNYEEECLDLVQLGELSERLRSRAESLGLKYRADTPDYGDEGMTNTDIPLCSEPWKTVYPVSRGILPCCFGREPIAFWDQRGDKSLEHFVHDSINNSAMQEIRRALAARQLGEYCRACTSCPIVKRHLVD